MHPGAGNPASSREDVQKALHLLLGPLQQHTSPGCARVRVGHTAAHFDDVAAEVEGFARPLWGAVPNGFGFSGLDDGIDWETYRKGLTNGTDPDHEEYWGQATDWDQRFVEVGTSDFCVLNVFDVFDLSVSVDGTDRLRTGPNS